MTAQGRVPLGAGAAIVPGDRVRLKRARQTIQSAGRPQRQIQAGVEGLVERVAVGSLARVVVQDAPDGRTDVTVVSVHDLERLA